MECMFYNASVFNCDLSEWEISEVNNINYIFTNSGQSKENINEFGRSKNIIYHEYELNYDTIKYLDNKKIIDQYVKRGKLFIRFSKSEKNIHELG